jgi:hypothetical protein
MRHFMPSDAAVALCAGGVRPSAAGLVQSQVEVTRWSQWVVEMTLSGRIADVQCSNAFYSARGETECPMTWSSGGWNGSIKYVASVACQ